MHLHQGVPEVVAHERGEQAREVEQVDAAHEDREGHDRVGEHAHGATVQRTHEELPRAAFALDPGARQGPQRERRRGTGDEQHGGHHRHEHVADHVRAEQHMGVQAHAADRRVGEHEPARAPGDRTAHRPPDPAAPQGQDAGRVERDAEHEEHQREAVGGPPQRQPRRRRRRRHREPEDLRARVVRQRRHRRGRRPAERHREAEGRCHDRELGDRDLREGQARCRRRPGRAPHGCAVAARRRRARAGRPPSRAPDRRRTWSAGRPASRAGCRR